jgi:anti-anti-sigma factor
VRVTLSGDFDVYRTHDIASMLPDPRSADRVVIDCSQVRFADSTFLVALMRYRRKFVQAGGDELNIILVASEFVRRILQISGLTKVLTVLCAPQIKEDCGEEQPSLRST